MVIMLLCIDLNVRHLQPQVKTRSPKTRRKHREGSSQVLSGYFRHDELLGAVVCGLVPRHPSAPLGRRLASCHGHKPWYFSSHPPPNRACNFHCTRLSSEILPTSISSSCPACSAWWHSRQSTSVFRRRLHMSCFHPLEGRTPREMRLASLRM